MDLHRRAYTDKSGAYQKIGPYRISSRLGKGGMGVVYRAVDERRGSPVALKIIDARFLGASGANARRRFEREVSILRALDHPNVLHLLDAGISRTDTGTEAAFFVSELLQGCGLDELDAPLERAEALRIAIGVAEGLAYLEARGVQHRDVKPGNVFIESKGRVVLIDFGLARADGLSRLTQTGIVVGSVQYMAPERLEGAECGLEADLYSLGLLLFMMLTGDQPFPRDALAAERAIHAHFGIVWKDKWIKQLSTDTTVNLIQKLLDPDPLNRPSVERVLDVLRKLASAGDQLLPGDPTAVLASPNQDVFEIDPTQPFDTVTSDAMPQVEVFAPTVPSEAATIEPEDVAPAKSLARPPWWVVGATAGVAFLAGVALTGLYFTTWRAPQDPIEIAHEPQTQTSEVPPPVQPRPEPPPVVPPKEPPEPIENVNAEVAVAAPPLLGEARSPAADVLPEFPTGQSAIAYGKTAAGEGRAEDAASAFRAALRINPTLAEAHRLLGDHFYDASDMASARRHYSTYLLLQPKAPGAKQIRDRLKRSRR